MFGSQEFGIMSHSKHGDQMNQNRRDFISTAASAFALSGCSSLGLAAKKPEPSFVWSYLVHFGYNSWIDAPIEKQDKTKIKPSLIDDYCADHVRFSETSWRRGLPLLKSTRQRLWRPSRK